MSKGLDMAPTDKSNKIIILNKEDHKQEILKQHFKELENYDPKIKDQYITPCIRVV